MRFVFVLEHYLAWHYGRALAEFSHIYRDIIGFVYNFFSIGILLRSYFAPWRRMGEDYPEDKFDFASIGSTLVVNTIMRLVGIFMRTVIIIVGLLMLFLVAIFYPVLLFVWLLWPLLIPFLFLLGLGLVLGI